MTFPFTFMPSNGVHFDLVNCMCFGIVHSCSKSTWKIHASLWNSKKIARFQAAIYYLNFVTLKYLYISVFLSRKREYSAGIFIEPLDDVIDGKATLTDSCEQQRKHGLQTRVTWRRFLRILLLYWMRGCKKTPLNISFQELLNWCTRQLQFWSQ